MPGVSVSGNQIGSHFMFLFMIGKPSGVLPKRYLILLANFGSLGCYPVPLVRTLIIPILLNVSCVVARKLGSVTSPYIAPEHRNCVSCPSIGFCRGFTRLLGVQEYRVARKLGPLGKVHNQWNLPLIIQADASFLQMVLLALPSTLALEFPHGR